MTNEERRELRMVARDLEAQISRCHDPAKLAVLERILEGVRREQKFDRQVSPRSKRKKAA